MIAVVDVAFFLIISFVVLLMASLVALLGKKFPQWQLSWRTVLFCAGCAIVLAAVLPRLLLSWANLEMTFVILVACAVGGAWMAAKLPGCMPAMSAVAVLPVADASILDQSSPSPVEEKQQEEPAIAQFVMDKPERPLPAQEEVQGDLLATRKKTASKIQKEEVATTGAAGANLADKKRLRTKRKTPAQIVEKRVEAVASPSVVTAAEPETTQLPETEPKKMATTSVVVAAEVDPIVVSEEFTAPMPVVESSLSEEPQEISATEKLEFAEQAEEEIPAAFTSVDACLEEAWKFREAGSWQTAQKVLQAGLAQFVDDEELPFLLIEEGALLKRYGRWEEAIAALQAALALPQVRQQSVWQKDIQQTLGYLQIFLGVLRQLKLETVAPEAIPASVLEKVETIYQQWRSRQ